MQFRYAGPLNAGVYAPSPRTEMGGHSWSTRTVKPERPGNYTRKNLDSLQVMRGMAALAVAFYHTNVILSMPEYGGINVLGPVAGFGWLGVNFFFALSGYIILFAHRNDIDKPDSIGKYFWRRIARVYPIYWIFLTLFTIAALKGLGSHEIQFSPRQLFSVYSLFPVMSAPPLPLKVAWTLMIEVKFYLVFAVLIVSRRVGIAVMLLWALAIVARNCLAPPADFAGIWPDYGMLSIWNVYFLCGMLTCFAIPRIPAAFGPHLLAAGVALLCWTAYGAPSQEFAMHMPPLLTKFAFEFSLIIAGGVMCEQRYDWKIPKALTLLGDASYSIYLVHSAVLSLVAQVNYKVAFEAFPPHVVYAGAFVAAVTAGVCAHVLVEKPIVNLLRDRRPKFNAERAGGLAARVSAPAWWRPFSFPGAEMRSARTAVRLEIEAPV